MVWTFTKDSTGGAFPERTRPATFSRRTKFIQIRAGRRLSQGVIIVISNPIAELHRFLAHLSRPQPVRFIPPGSNRAAGSLSL